MIRIRVPLVRPLVRCNIKRLFKLLPSALLLLFVFSLIFVTLMQIAVIHSHRRTQYGLRQELLNTTPGTTHITTPGIPSQVFFTRKTMPRTSTVATVAARPKKNVILRVEAFLDKNAVTVEANVAIMKEVVNSVRVRDILQSLKSTMHDGCVDPLRTSNQMRQVVPPGDEEESDKYMQEHRRNYSCPLNFKTSYDASKFRMCAAVPPLVGRINVEMPSRNRSQVDDLLRRSPYLRGRGCWTPPHCTARHRVAVIIPFRDRHEHLATLLYVLHPLMQRQLLEYEIFVVEQYGNDTFNKGVLMNAGVKESLKHKDFQCYVFHDVDMIPEDDRNLYSCPPMPRHLSVGVDKFNYTLPYNLLVGGAFAIRVEDFFQVNGYSNLYWGWGGEDDDMAYRIVYKKLKILRPPEAIGRYTMIKHKHRKESPRLIRTALLRMAKKRSPKEGYTTAKYKLLWRHEHLAYTHLMIDIGKNHQWKFYNNQRLVINF